MSRQLVQVMKEYHLSLFATGAVGYYSRIGLLPDLTALQVRVVSPARGATLKGTSLLDAIATDSSGVTKVEFHLDGEGVHDALIGTGEETGYGWIASFKSTEYPDGSYELRSVASGPGGVTSDSPSIKISLENHG